MSACALPSLGAYVRANGLVYLFLCVRKGISGGRYSAPYLDSATSLCLANYQLDTDVVDLAEELGEAICGTRGGVFVNEPAILQDELLG